MSHYFLDTSVLKYRFFKGKHSRSIKRIVSDRRNICYIADHTIIEIASALASTCREWNWDAKKFDDMNNRFFRDLSSGILQVRPTTKHDVLRASHLIRYAGVEKKRSLKSGDSLIATSALEFALENQVRVIFYTGDKTLYSILQTLSAFTSALKLRCLP